MARIELHESLEIRLTKPTSKYRILGNYDLQYNYCSAGLSPAERGADEQVRLFVGSSIRRTSGWNSPLRGCSSAPRYATIITAIVSQF